MQFRIAATFWYNTKGEYSTAGITRFAELYTGLDVLQALNETQDKIFNMRDAIDVDLLKFVITVEYNVGTWDMRHTRAIEYV